MAEPTTASIIDALGGTSAVADQLGYSYQRVWNWRASNRFPARTRDILRQACREHDIPAPACLWNMVEAA